MKLIISESKNFIIITCQLKENKVLSWEQLQEVKDELYPNKDFVEIYPKKEEIINKANERHLVHQKGIKVPKMGDFEEEAEVFHLENFEECTFMDENCFDSCLLKERIKSIRENIKSVSNEDFEEFLDCNGFESFIHTNGNKLYSEETVIKIFEKLKQQ